MDLYDILFLVLFLIIWFVLITRIFPRFGVGT